MPRSIQFTHEIGAAKQFAQAISCTPNLSELLELVPAPYRPRMQDLVYEVYRAAVKSNNTRSYVANLEKHEQDGDFPPEIGARIATPALQISKEFSATAECRSLQAELDNTTLANKKVALKSAIALKRQELAHLQSVFAEDQYKGKADAIMDETVALLVDDAGMAVHAPDGSTADASWPQWIRDDYYKMKQYRLHFPARAVALAFMQASSEMSRKMRGLSLKKKADDDVEMMDDASRTDNVDKLVERKFQALMKEHKLQNVGNNGKGKRTNSSSKPNPNGKLPYKVGKGQRGNSPGGKGKSKKQNKK